MRSLYFLTLMLFVLFPACLHGGSAKEHAPLLVVVWTSECPKCEKDLPMVMKIIEHCTVNAKKVDVATESGKEFKKVFDVKRVPTYIFIENSIEVFRSDDVKRTYESINERFPSDE